MTDFTPQGDINLRDTYKILGIVAPTEDTEAVNKKYVDDNIGGFPEGINVRSTGETGGTKYLREDGDGTCSWQSSTGGVTTSGTPIANDFARFTDATTIEGRSYSEVRTDLNIEDGADVTDATNVASAGAAMAGGAFHDGFSDFVADEHLNWNNSVGTIHADNYTNTTYVAGDFAHDSLASIPANDHIDWTADQGATNIHSGNYTDTTYAANQVLDWTVDQGGTNINSGNYTNTGDTTAHASFSQLDYASSGHTGFAPALTGDQNYVTDDDITLLGNTSGVNTGDNSANSNYSGLVTNQTHTGDVTGSIALTIASGAVDIAMLSATGVASSSNFLRGDNQWATPSGSGNVSTSGSPVDNDFAKFVSGTDIEGRSYSEVRTDLNVADGSTANSADATLLARANHTGTQTASTISDFDTEVGNNSAVALNTAKVTNVDTNLSEGTSTTTTVDVNSSDGTNATLVAASTSRAGLMTKAKFDEIVANTSARHAQSHTIASHSDTTGTGAELDELTDGSTTTLHNHTAPSIAHSATTGRTANDHHNESHTVASHSDTTATGAELNTLTGGGDTTLHDHAGISENTSARHTQGTDTTLGSGAVAADHGTATTDQIVNVCYGTSATPPTASTTTEGTLYVQYTA